MFNLFNAIALETTTAPADGSKGNNPWSSVLLIAFYALIIFAFYFFLMRPQKKRQKEETKMRENVQIGDKIITAGGISGRVIATKDKEVIIETGSDRTKLSVMRWAIQFNETKHDDIAEK